MDFVGGNAGLQIDVAYVNFMTTYAATAWYHRGRPEPACRSAARSCARPRLLRVMSTRPCCSRGREPRPTQRRTALDGLARYTGVSAAYWDKANLRMNEDRFLQELLRDRGKVVGRVDTRYTGGNSERDGRDHPVRPVRGGHRARHRGDVQRLLPQRAQVESDREYVLSGSAVEQVGRAPPPAGVDHKCRSPTPASTWRTRWR